MSKIIGITVGTPTSPARMELALNPVKTVNGIAPDENGNVEVSNGVDFTTDATLTLDPETKVLRVNTTNDMEQDNTRPITSAGVYAAVGNIEALLKTI